MGWFNINYNPYSFKDNTLSKSPVSIWPKKDVMRKVENIIELIKDECLAFGIDAQDIKTNKICIEVYLNYNKEKKIVDYMPLREYLAGCVRDKWNSMIVSEDNLQSMVIKLLGNREFKLEAALYFGEKYGAKETLNLIKKIDTTWKLRV
jgi:hypothetical protein